MLFLVPKNRNSEPCIGFTSAPVDDIIPSSLPLVVIRIGPKVQVFDVRRLIERVHVCTGELVYVCKGPSVCTHPRRNNRHGYTIRASWISVNAGVRRLTYDIFKTFQLPQDECTRSPGLKHSLYAQQNHIALTTRI